MTLALTISATGADWGGINRRMRTVLTADVFTWRPMLLYTLVIKWFADEGHRHYRPAVTTWYAKPYASFGDMLATLRRLSVREQSIEWGLHGPGSQKLQQALENMLALAA